MFKLEIDKNWYMSQVGADEMIPAVVPGTVYTDLLREGKMEDPFWKDNEDAALALMDFDYLYQTTFTAPEELLAYEQLLLYFDGIDTLADVYLNGQLLGSTNNMHRQWEFDVCDEVELGENELKVVLHSPTKFIAEAYAAAPTRGTEDAMEGFVHIRKAHCMFGWDWGAHLPDAGIFRSVSLLAFNRAKIRSVYVRQNHESGCVNLELIPELEWASGAHKDSAELEYKVSIFAPDNSCVVKEEACLKHAIDAPKLWWPNGYGEQNLYTVSVDLYDAKTGIKLDNWTRKIGLRTMTMNRTLDQWGESFACCVNGVEIFAMGADYIPEDHLIGRVSPDTTRALLEKCKWANFNSIRVWGGGYYPSDWFFDICDELGLVVWQDFMFACAVYDLTPEFEANIRAEFADNIRRLRHHASLALWCGNNEMEDFVAQRNEWVTKESEVTDYLAMYERVIPEVLAEHDPDRFYWPSSPSSGGSFDKPNDENRGDVHYWDVWHGNKPFSEYRKFYFRYLSEFGFQSFPSLETIKTFTDDENDFNIFSYIMERHQRNGSANGKIMNYMQQTYRYPTKFETVLYASQMLQADAIRYGVEHFRRNRGRCMGAIYWQLNDCWPVASWASIDYCGRFKALHYHAKRFFAPLMLSCEEQGALTAGRDLVRQNYDFEKSIRLNVANETMADEDVIVRWYLRNADASIIAKGDETLHVSALSSSWMDKIEFREIDIYSTYVGYELVRVADDDEEIISEGTVIFTLPKYFKYENPELKACPINGTAEIEISASAYAKGVEILNEDEDLILSDNYFDMNAGTKRVKVISGDASKLRVRSVYDIR